MGGEETLSAAANEARVARRRCAGFLDMLSDVSPVAGTADLCGTLLETVFNFIKGEGHASGCDMAFLGPSRRPDEARRVDRRVGISCERSRWRPRAGACDHQQPCRGPT